MALYPDASLRRLPPLRRRGGDGLVPAGCRCPDASLSLDPFSLPVPVGNAPFNDFLNLVLKVLFTSLSGR